ncbi:hypothetical protein U1Q18_046146, partial [Sarracenia purpurea var. burkii]
MTLICLWSLFHVASCRRLRSLFVVADLSVRGCRSWLEGYRLDIWISSGLRLFIVAVVCWLGSGHCRFGFFSCCWLVFPGDGLCSSVMHLPPKDKKGLLDTALGSDKGHYGRLTVEKKSEPTPVPKGLDAEPTLPDDGEEASAIGQ